MTTSHILWVKTRTNNKEWIVKYLCRNKFRLFFHRGVHFGLGEAGPVGRLSIKMSSYHYRDPHVKGKTVLSLTWESSYLGKMIFILRRRPGWKAVKFTYVADLTAITEQSSARTTRPHRKCTICKWYNNNHENTVHPITWWRHQMETFSALLAFCAGNSPVTGEFPAQRPVTQSIDVFFDMRLN